MSNFKKRLLSSIIILPTSLYFIIQGSLLLVLFLIICFLVACYEWNMMTKKISFKIFGFFFLIFSFYTFYELSVEYRDILFVIFICVSTDIGGYVFGKIIKGPKLTKISPNKTYAGMIGGYLLSLIYLLIITKFLYQFNLSFKIFVITIIISTISQTGDIVISYFKRLSKIKNTGKIIPGHGGLLDRIDGMIFAFPIYYFINQYSLNL